MLNLHRLSLAGKAISLIQLSTSAGLDLPIDLYKSILDQELCFRSLIHQTCQLHGLTQLNKFIFDLNSIQCLPPVRNVKS